jgi:hypothetical protein
VRSFNCIGPAKLSALVQTRMQQHAESVARHMQSYCEELSPSAP